LVIAVSVDALPPRCSGGCFVAKVDVVASTDALLSRVLADALPLFYLRIPPPTATNVLSFSILGSVVGVNHVA
jgi:hypothetical protein